MDNELIPNGTKVTRSSKPAQNWTILSPTLHTKLLPSTRAYMLQNEDTGETTVAQITDTLTFAHLTYDICQ
jgi:hypothetical protein